jgi:hypothetical protein
LGREGALRQSLLDYTFTNLRPVLSKAVLRAASKAFFLLGQTRLTVTTVLGKSPVPLLIGVFGSGVNFLHVNFMTSCLIPTTYW